MDTFTTLRAHERTSPHRRDNLNVRVCSRHAGHICWLYRQMRMEGLSRSDARMNLVFALAAGQRDMRTRVEQSMSGI